MRKKFIDIELGSRGFETGQKLYEAIDAPEIKKVATDYWKPYEAFVPKNIHTQSKAETYTVEGYNSIFRHFLARLRRKTKCYSKSTQMLRYSMSLLIEKWNNQLAILN